MRNLMNASEDEMTAAFAQEQRENEARAPASGINENVRLLLQGFEDQGPGNHGGVYMALYGIPEIAIKLGFLKRINPPPPGGCVTFQVTPEGRAALAAANEALGDMATRYVHEVKYFGDLEPVVYGYPFLWPLSAPTRKIKGTFVADRRVIAKPVSMLKRLFS